MTRAVGLITSPRQTERIIATGQADQVALARAFIDKPSWGWHAADALGAPGGRVPPQYLRGRDPGRLKWKTAVQGLFGAGCAFVYRDGEIPRDCSVKRVARPPFAH